MLAFLARLGVFAFALSASTAAQCLDWATGFGVPGNGATGIARAMIEFDDGSGSKLYLAGVLPPSIPTARGVVAWDGVAWSVLGDLGANSYVTSLAVFDDGSGSALYAGGDNLTVGGISARRLAKWTPGVGWSAPADQPNSRVDCLATIDLGTGPLLYVGGGFTSIGALGAIRVASWDGASWAALGLGLNQGVVTFGTFDSGSGPVLYAGGYFTHSGTNLVGHLGRWDGTSWMPPSAGTVTEAVYALQQYDDGSGSRLFIGGTGPIRALSPGASAYTLLTSNSALIWDFQPFDDGSGMRLFIAGGFVYPGLKPSGGVVAWNGTSFDPLGLGIVPAAQSDTNKPRALAAYTDALGTGLYVAGGFTHAGGHPSRNIARWGSACTSPTITLQPNSASANLTQPVVFEVVAQGTGPLTYEWTHDGVPISGGSGLSGWDGPVLTIAPWGWNSRGTYRCSVTGLLGSVLSDEVTLTIPAGGTSGAPVQLTPVALQGDPVPGSPGLSLTNVYIARQASDGTTVVYERASDASYGLHLYDGSTVERVVATGSPAPGTAAGVAFENFDPPWAANGGQFTTRATLAGPGITTANRTGLWHGDANGLTLIARTGDAPAGWSVPGEVFGPNTLGALTGTNGHVVYTGVVTAGTTTVCGTLFGWTATGGSSLWIRTGDIAPGTTATLTSFQSIGLVNANGQCAVQAQTSAGPGLWLAGPSGLTPLLVGGELLPGSPNHETIAEPWQRPLVGDDGAVACGVRTVGDSGYSGYALVRWTSAGLETVARSGDPAPGATPTTFNQFYVVGMNDVGGLLFYSTLSNTTSGPYAGYWYITPQGVFQPVALGPGLPLPEVPSAFTFWRFWQAALDDSGRVIVTAQYTNGGSAIFGWTEQTGLFPIAVPGGIFEPHSGDVRVLSGAGLHTYEVGPGGPSPSSSFDSQGGVSLQVGFTDSPGGVVVARFAQLLALYHAPGSTICVGDGSGTACPCGNSGGSASGCANSLFAAGASLDAFGAASITDDSLRFEAESLPNSSCLLFQGTQLIASGAGTAFGDGLRCAGGTIQRLGIRGISGNSQSFGHGAPGDAPISANGQVSTPGSRIYQVWYRNAAAFCTPSTFNLTNGVQIDWAP